MACLYDHGASLAEIAKLFFVTRQAVYKMLKRRSHALRSPNINDMIEHRGENYTLRENGYYAKTTGDRSYLHRDVYSEANGPIPPDTDVHHLDGDKTNNTPENLTLETKSEHGRRHGFGGNQYTGSLGARPVKW